MQRKGIYYVGVHPTRVRETTWTYRLTLNHLSPPPGKCDCTRAQSMILNAHESLCNI